MAGLQDGADALGDHVVRHLVDVVAEEPRVVDAGLLGERLDPGPRGERGAGLVEADVSVGADAQDLEVHAAGRGQRQVVRLARGLHVLGGAVRAHEGVGAEAERLDHLADDGGAVGLRVPGGQPDVLVELADAGPRHVHVTGGDLGGQRVVDRDRGRAGGHAEQRVGLAAPQGGDRLRDELAACPGVRDDDNFHVGLPIWRREFNGRGIDQSSRTGALRSAVALVLWSAGRVATTHTESAIGRHGRCRGRTPPRPGAGPAPEPRRLQPWPTRSARPAMWARPRRRGRRAPDHPGAAPGCGPAPKAVDCAVHTDGQGRMV